MAELGGYSEPTNYGIPVAAFSLFGLFALSFQKWQKQREQVRMQEQQASAATLPPEAALQMMQTVGGLPPAAQMAFLLLPNYDTRAPCTAFSRWSV